jgi:hypothetical protein
MRLQIFGQDADILASRAGTTAGRDAAHDGSKRLHFEQSQYFMYMLIFEASANILMILQ